MLSAGSGLFSREEILGGLGGRLAKRVSALVYLIEIRTAHLTERSRRAQELYPSEAVAGDEEAAFLEALAGGREAAELGRITIHEIEAWAPDWADLVPPDPRLRAGVIRALGERYQIPAGRAPNLTAALGVDDPVVRSAYRRQFGESIEASFVSPPELSWRTKARWRLSRLSARLNALPVFWIAYSLTLTETVGIGILALPIAVAAVGPWPGVALLAVVGLVNVATVAAVAETLTRTGSVRYEGAFFRRVVAEYLGPLGSGVLSAVLVLHCAISLLGRHIGLSAVLDSATGVPPPVWIASLSLILVYVVGRDTLNTTIASAIVVGAVNLAVIAFMALLALGHLDWDNLDHANVPGFGGEPFAIEPLRVVGGVVLLAYFGHFSVGCVARVALPRDPGGRSLVRGVAAAKATSVVVYCLWVLAVGGAVAPDALIGRQGTVLEPLEEVVGPLIVIPGATFVVLGLGMGAVHNSLGLANAVKDCLPRRSSPLVSLARGRSRLIFRPRQAGDDGPRLELTYLGCEGGTPRLRLRTSGDSIVQDLRLSGDKDRFSAGDDRGGPISLSGLVDAERLRGLKIELEAIAATDDHVDLHVVASWPFRLEGVAVATGLNLLDGRGEPGARDLASGHGPHDHELVRWLLRRGAADLESIAAWAGIDERAARDRVDALVAAGLVTASVGSAETTYRPLLRRRGRRELPKDVGRVLDDLTGGDAASPEKRKPFLADEVRRRLEGFGRSAADRIASDRIRLALALTPTVGVFVLAEWLAISGRASFTEVLGLGGIVGASLCAGVFPALMLAAARRRGDLVPAVVYRPLGNPVVLGGIVVAFLGVLLLHGLVVWSSWWARAGALGAAAVVAVVSVAAARRGAFARQVVVAVRVEGRATEALFMVVAAGEPLAVEVEQLHDGRPAICAADGVLPLPLSGLRFRLPPLRARDLKVIAQRFGVDGVEALPVVIRVDPGDGVVRRYDPRPTGGKVLVSLGTGTAIVEVVPDDAGGANLDASR